jgi:hypothetical protein
LPPFASSAEHWNPHRLFVSLTNRALISRNALDPPGS